MWDLRCFRACSRLWGLECFTCFGFLFQVPGLEAQSASRRFRICRWVFALEAYMCGPTVTERFAESFEILRCSRCKCMVHSI